MTRKSQLLEELTTSSFCLYVRVDLPIGTEDSYLLDTVVPLLAEVIGPQRFSRFFFVRYGEPDFHLRLRFFGERSAVLGAPRRHVLDQLNRAVRPRSRTSLRVCQYYPEFKRYGGKLGVRLAEKVFAASTRAALGFLEENDRRRCSKTEFAVASAEALLDALGLSRTQRDRLFQSYSVGLLGGMIRKDEEKRRAAESLIAALSPILKRTTSNPRGYWKGRDPVFDRLTCRLYSDLRPIRENWTSLSPRIDRPLGVLATSYLHMHLNRLALFPLEEHILRSARRSFSA